MGHLAISLFSELQLVNYYVILRNLLDEWILTRHFKSYPTVKLTCLSSFIPGIVAVTKWNWNSTSSFLQQRKVEGRKEETSKHLWFTWWALIFEVIELVNNERGLGFLIRKLVRNFWCSEWIPRSNVVDCFEVGGKVDG